MSSPGRRRWRASLIIALFVLAVAASASVGWWYARESPPHQGPIVLISADNLAADGLAAYAASAPARPAIDALAADGVVFDRAYAQSPLTLPAHASLFSGQLPAQHGVRDDAGFAIKEETRTLAELMRNRGFNTGAAVSTFLLRRASGVAQGFSFFDAELPDKADGEGPVATRDAAQTVDAAERWLKTQDGQRFMLFVQVDDAAADDAVGRLVADLKARGLYDTATIVLMGDHGNDSASLSDAALHVPLIVKQPENEGAGRRVASPVQQIDLLPTILDLVRAPIPSGIQGRSLRPVLDDEDGTVRDQPIFSESLAGYFRLGCNPAYALTSGMRRFVRTEGDALYDLETGGQSLPLDTPDPAGLKAALDRLAGTARVSEPGPIAPADEDAFAALGYLPEPRLVTPAPVDLHPAAARGLIAAHRAAALLVAEKKYAAAVDRLRGITRAHPELAVVHYQIGSLLQRMARYAEATAAFNEAARLQPDSAQIQTALATTALRAGDRERAAAIADRAVVMAQTYQPEMLSRAHEVAARVALARADADAAVMHADAAHAADETLALPQFVRGRLLLDEGKFEEAIEPLQEAVAAAKNGTAVEDLHASLGDALMRAERYADAEAQYREELRAFPRNIRAYSSLAMLYRASNREADVAQVIGDLITAAPTPEGYGLAARLWTIAGNRSRAEALRSDARTRFRGDPSLALLESR